MEQNTEEHDREQSLLTLVDSKPSTSSQSQKPRTRHTAELFGVGPAICSDDATITGCRLPTGLQVLRCMMYHCNEASNSDRPGAVGATPRFTTAKLVLQQIATFYEKANIPMVSHRRCCEKIVKLLDDNNKLRAISKDRRDTPATMRKLEENQCILASTFQLWPPNVEALIKNEEDHAFLQSMKTGRTACFGSFDKLLAQKVVRRNERATAAVEQAKRARLARDAAEAAVSSDLIDSSDNDDPVAEHSDSSDTEDFSALSAGKKSSESQQKTGISIVIAPDIIRKPKIVSLATRLKMTPMQQAAYTQGLISESGGDVSVVATSYATADRSRRKIAGEITANIKDQWKPPKLCTLHWDGKLTATLVNHSVTEERVTVLVGDASEMKLLGVPSYKKATDQKTGTLIADLTVKLATEWQCGDKIVNLAFDTTSANTGHLSAACIAIQEKLQRAVLWSGCRHHIGELVLSHVFSDLKIETSKSPDVTLFTRLRTNWELLPHSSAQALTFQTDNHTTEAQKLLATMRAETIAYASEVLEFVREDYLEFTELSLFFLGAKDGEVGFRRPGALHKARWMAKVIYSLKIALAENSIEQLPPGTITSRHQVTKVREFVTFVTHVYLMWWLSCKKAVDAPWNDLQLFKSLLQYEVVNQNISKSAVRAFSRHLWYLTSEMVPVALFSSVVPSAERQHLADALLRVQPATDLQSPQSRFGSGWGKPRFPSSIDLSTTLCDLVDADSWFTIFRLEIDASFLQLPVSEWDTNEAYLASAQNVKALNVVNDAAERGVKLATDFVDAARSDEHFQNILHVVEDDRKQNPNLRLKKK